MAGGSGGGVSIYSIYIILYTYTCVKSCVNGYGSDVKVNSLTFFGRFGLAKHQAQDEAEVIRLANQTSYGLAGAIFTSDRHKARVQ